MVLQWIEDAIARCVGRVKHTTKGYYRRAKAGVTPSATTRGWAVFLFRLFFFPIFLLRALLLLPRSFVYDTTPALSSPRPRRRRRHGNSSHRARPYVSKDALLAAMGSVAGRVQGTAQVALASLFLPDFQIAVRRAIAAYNVSLLLLYHSLVYTAFAVVVRLFRADSVLESLRRLLQSGLSRFIGRYQTIDGQRVTYSLVNSVDITFSIPWSYNPARDLPFARLQPESTLRSLHADDPHTAHFMALSAKLAYEDMRVVRDVVVAQWGFRWLAGDRVRQRALLPGHAPPREISWFTFCNDRATVVVFRGTRPLELINWETDSDLSMSKRSDIGGVHNGLFAALFQLPENAQACIFDELLSALHQAIGRKKDVFVTGHSLGGALASVFVQALQAKRPEMAEQIAGVYTFGQPRVGDSQYVEKFYASFANRCYRFVHAADIVAKAPPIFGYTHHPCERYIPSFYFGRLQNRYLKAEIYADQVEAWRRTESRLVIPFTLLKLFAGHHRGESMLRTLSRLLLLPLPGLSDHLPADYERALREVAAAEKLAPAPLVLELPTGLEMADKAEMRLLEEGYISEDLDLESE